MAFDANDVAAQIDPLVSKAQGGIKRGGGGYGPYYAETGDDTSALFTRMLAIIERLTPPREHLSAPRRGHSRREGTHL